MADSKPEKSPMDEWDEAFESSDPTRVLSPLDYEDTSATTQFDRAESQYLEERRKSSQQNKKPAEFQNRNQKFPPFSPDSPLYIDEEEYEASNVENTEYVYDDQSVATRYHRLQALPCFIGWLVSYAVLQLGTTAYSLILKSFGASDFGTVGNLLPTLQTNTTTATPWLVALGLTIFCAYATGGYTASRLARYAAFKQGLGVFLWGLLTTVAASIFVALTNPETQLIFSYQHLSNNNFDTGLIGAIAFFALAFISSSTGALFGKRYEHVHKK